MPLPNDGKGTWANVRPEETAVLQEIGETNNDRSAAIVCAPFVEERLADKLRSLLIKDAEIQESLFRPSGPVGSFGVKIDLGYLMGIYNRDMWKQLTAIKRIRNKFAYSLSHMGFGSQKIRDNCKLLTISERNFVVEPYDSSLGILPRLMFVELDGRKKDYYRQRYVKACQVFALLLMMSGRARGPRRNVIE